MWEVHYSLEAATYLEDNSELIIQLFFTMESLADTEGFPIKGEYQELQGRIYWSVEQHLVVYRRMARTKVNRIIFIKPQ